MIFDDRPSIRELGFRRILKARSLEETRQRTFKMPQINPAKEYHLMINWQTCRVTEPPFTKRYESETLVEMMKNGRLLDYPQFPNHTQAWKGLLSWSRMLQEWLWAKMPAMGSLDIDSRVEESCLDSKLKRITCLPTVVGVVGVGRGRTRSTATSS